MRNLTDDEIQVSLDDNGESDDGCIAIESTTTELGKMKVSTICGSADNECFIKIAEAFPNRSVRGWYDKERNEMWGMLHIQCTKEEGASIEMIAAQEGGSLRFDGQSGWNGYCEFEIE